MRPDLITCEHASARVPARWRGLFVGAAEVLATHRGWDIGAAELARELGRALQIPVVLGRATRLLVDLNRSPSHPQLLSPWTRTLVPAQKERLLDELYRPYRERVERSLRAGLGRQRRVVHVSVHSFTPVLEGRVRDVDIGLLYDPARPAEVQLARRLKHALARGRPDLRVRSNRPYRGTSDGFIPWLRAHLPRTRYAGIEIEINQRFPLGATAEWKRLRRQIRDALAAL